MVSEKTPEKQNQCKIGDGYDCLLEEGLKKWVDNTLMLVAQEIEGLSKPIKIHGGSAVAKKLEAKGKEEEVIFVQQPPKEKSSIRLFTTDFKPRLRWTPELHARFVDALNELGGPDKVTPKLLLDTIGIEGLEIHHVKSHLQKYRRGKVTVRDWPQVPKFRTAVPQPSAGPSIGTSTSYQTLQAYGCKKFKGEGEGDKVKKIYEMHKDGRGQLYLKLQAEKYLSISHAETFRKFSNALIQETSEKLDDEHNGAADADAAGMSQQDLASVATTPSSHSIPESKRPINITADKMEGSGLPQKISCSASWQSEKVVHSAIAGCIDSQVYPFPYNSTAAVSVHVLLQNEVHTSQAPSATDGLQSQNTTYSAINGFPTSNVNYSETMAYLQDYQPQRANFCFTPQNASYGYQPQSAYFNFQAQTASYDYYQPQCSAKGNQLQDAVFTAAAAYGYQPYNASYSAPNFLPTSKEHFSETAYLDDLNAALAAIGNTSLETINFDPVNAYINWDNLETNAQDNDISFTQMKEQRGQMESLATQKDKTK